MLQKMLTLFTTEEKAQLMLESPIIHFIFLALFVLFILAVTFHLIIFLYLRKIRNDVKASNSLQVDPLHSFKREFEYRQTEVAFKTETFVQEKFSSWRFLGIPLIGFMKIIHMTISVFILLGVLGTFIGLTISLGNINGADEQLIENVSGVLSGIDIAFYTSIVGMSFSLIMTLLLKVLNAEFVMTDLMLIVESHLESHEKHGMHRVIKVSEMIHESLGGVVSAFDGFKDYTSGLKETAKDLVDFNDGLRENLTVFQKLFQEMSTVTETFGNGTDALNKNFTMLFNYFKDHDERNKQLINSFEKTADHMETMTSKQAESLSQFETEVELLKQFTERSIEKQGTMTHQVENIAGETKALVATMQAEKNQLQEIFGTDLTWKLEGITTALHDLQHGFTSFGDALVPLPTALESIEHTQQTQNKLMEERIHDLQTFNTNYNDHLQQHRTQAQALERNIQQTSAIYEKIASKNNHLLSEMENAIQQLAATFQKRDTELGSNVDLVRDTLMNYASTLEGTLGQKLDNLIRNIDNSMYTQQDTMKRDFIEVRKMSEELNETHARAIQQLLTHLTNEIQQLHRVLQTNHAPSSIGQIRQDL